MPARTKPPARLSAWVAANWSALFGAAMLLISAFAFAPVNARVDHLETRVLTQEQVSAARAEASRQERVEVEKERAVVLERLRALEVELGDNTRVLRRVEAKLDRR